MSTNKRRETVSKLSAEFSAHRKSFAFIPSREVTRKETTSPYVYGGLFTYYDAESQQVRSVYGPGEYETRTSRMRFLLRYGGVLKDLRTHPHSARDETSDTIINRAAADLGERRRTLLANFSLMSGTEHPESSEDYFLGCFVSKAVDTALRFSLRDEVIEQRPEPTDKEDARALQAMATNSHNPAAVTMTSLRVVSGYLPSPPGALMLCLRDL
jgi:hypothetical protein